MTVAQVEELGLKLVSRLLLFLWGQPSSVETQSISLYHATWILDRTRNAWFPGGLPVNAIQICRRMLVFQQHFFVLFLFFFFFTFSLFLQLLGVFQIRFTEQSQLSLAFGYSKLAPPLVYYRSLALRLDDQLQDTRTSALLAPGALSCWRTHCCYWSCNNNR